MIDIGGSSFKNGIILYTDDIKVKSFYNDNNEIEVKVIRNYVEDSNSSKSNIKNHLLKIPFVRGIIRTINLISVVAFIAIDICKNLIKATDITKSNNILGYALLTIGLLLILVCIGIILYFIQDIKSTLRFHGAEHKVINTYESNKPITIYNISTSSRVSISCGSIFGIFLAFFMILFFILIPYKTIAYLLAISVSYELFRIDNPERYWYCRYFYKVGLLSQKYLTTLEPNEKELLIAKDCIINLLKILNNSNYYC